MAAFGGTGSAAATGNAGNLLSNFTLSTKKNTYDLHPPGVAGVYNNNSFAPIGSAGQGTPGKFGDYIGGPVYTPPGRRATESQVGGGGSVSSGGAAPAAGANWNVQANPYLDQVFNRFNDLWGRYDTLSKEAPDPEKAIQDYQRVRRQGWDEALAGAGRRGLTGGLALSQAQNYMQGTEQGAQGLAADWRNRALDFQKELLTGMTGALSGQGNVGSNIAGAQLGLSQLANDAQSRQQQYDYLMNVQAPLQLMQAQLSAATQLAGLV